MLDVVTIYTLPPEFQVVRLLSLIGAPLQTQNNPFQQQWMPTKTTYKNILKTNYAIIMKYFNQIIENKLEL